MMTLRTMQAVVATVDEQWESPLADAILERWAHDETDRAKYWRASANFIFFFKGAGQDAVLRFNHAAERSVAAIRAELAFVNALADRGVRVAKPIPSLAGNEVESVATANGTFHAVAFAALQGEQHEIEALSPAQFVQWGKTLGDLHNAAAEIRITGRPSWRDQLATVAQILPADERLAQRAVEKLQSQFDQLAVDEENFGLIHYDFELDNLIWHGEEIGIIDFDDSLSCWFVADIAFALRDLFDDNANKVNLQDPMLLQFLTGYRSVRAVDDTTLQQIPLFLCLHNLVAYARLHRALTAVDPAGELPWMAALREKLAAKMQSYRAGFST